jgi:predicted ester cyclase
VSTKESATLARRVIELLNKGKTAVNGMEEIYTTDFVYHAGSGIELRGLNDFKQYWGSIFNAFPDTHFSLEDIIVEGDKAVIRLMITGTHLGAYMGVPPTKKKVTNWAIEIQRNANGKLVETWLRWDTLGLMQQLGVIPTPGKGK